MSKCISMHGEFSEHEFTGGVCNCCGVAEPVTQEEIKNLILKHSMVITLPSRVICSDCGYHIAPRPGRQHWNVADHIADLIMTRLERETHE